MDINIKIDMPALDRFVDAIIAGAGISTATPKATPTPTATAKKVEAKVEAEPKTETVTDTGNTEELIAAAKAAALALQQKNGRDALIALLGEFGVANITAIPAEKLQSFIDTAKLKAA